MSLHARETVLKIQPYQAGKPIEEVQRELGLTDVIKLASNENPLGPAPLAVQAMTKAILESNIYPDGNNYLLKEKLSAALGVAPENVVFGAGASTVLKLIAEAFLCPGDELVYAHPSFIMYEYMAHLSGATPVVVPMTPDHRHDLPAMAAAITPRTRAVVICNPNNPTGTVVTQAEMDAFLARVPENVLVVLDEAYFEYANAPGHVDGLNYVKAGKNVLVLRSFSKIYGLAGLRVGYGVGPKDVADTLRRVREPFNVNSVAQAAVLGALSDKDHVARSRAVNDAGLEILYAGARALGLRYIPSAANFVMIHCGGADVKQVFQALLEQGVVVRPAFGTPGWIRVTVGTEAENRRFLDAMGVVLKKLAIA